MRIRALRVREFGCFEGAVAVEGLSGRLDVLVGPNERGKSTLFRALDTVFALKHSATGRQIDALRPWTGGDPMVEADFESEARLWRITKRFGRSRMAELTDLKAGRLVARNADADDRLADLLGGAESANAFGPRRGLLWVGQRQGLAPEKLKGEQDALITHFISREVEAAGGGRRAREVLRRVQAELDQLVTDARAKPKAGGRLANAIAWRERVGEAKASADAATVKAAAATEKLDRLEARIRDLEAPGRRPELQHRVADLRRQHEAGLAARQGLATKDAEVQAATLTRNKADEDVARFDAALAQHKLLTVQNADIAARLSTARVETARLASEVAVVRRRVDETAAAEQRLRRHAETLRAEASRMELVKRIERARTIGARHVEARTKRDRIQVTPDVLAAIERELRDLAAIEARLAAGAPSVRIVYAAGAKGRVRLDGRPLTDGETVRPGGPVRLDIDGIGSIEIAPADEDCDRASDLEDMARHRAVLKDLLGRCGMTDVGAARTAGERRAGLVRDVAALEAELGIVAPHGVDALERELGRLTREAGGRPDEARAEPQDPEAAATALLEAERATAEAHRASQRLDQQSAELQQKIAADAARLAAIEDQLAALERDLPTAEARQQVRAERVSRAIEAKSALERLLEEHMVVERQAPPLAEFSRLAADQEKATQALAAHDREVQDTRLDIARTEAEIDSISNAGDAARATEIAEELAAAATAVARIEEEVEALRLLAATIGEVLSETRERFLAPVVQRIAPALSRLLPGASLTFTSALEADTLERGPGRSEAVGVLSAGTQEQLAVLVRLALADLLADQGVATPVVLDDALVYADDARIEAMFREIERAAEKHQVIVLTCRARTFERLEGRRLAIDDWA